MTVSCDAKTDGEDSVLEKNKKLSIGLLEFRTGCGLASFYDFCGWVVQCETFSRTALTGRSSEFPIIGGPFSFAADDILTPFLAGI